MRALNTGNPFTPRVFVMFASLAVMLGLSANLVAAQEDSSGGGFVLTQNTKTLASTNTVQLGSSQIEYALSGDDFNVPKSVLHDWIENSALTVANYFGNFPTERLYIALVPVDGVGVKSGKAFSMKLPIINISFGRDSTKADFDNDWIMIHEMVHLGFPSLDERHLWFEEGIATYVEQVARANMGDLPAERVWSRFIDKMPQGLPEAGDKGLDHTPTWGRIYWGGALFCMLVDLEIRKATGNEHGLRDALRAVLASGATIQDEMTIQDALAIGDRGTNTEVLTRTYEQMKATPVDVDLEALWQGLGVRRNGDGVEVDDGARFAAIRERITATAKPSCESTPNLLDC